MACPGPQHHSYSEKVSLRQRELVVCLNGGTWKVHRKIPTRMGGTKPLSEIQKLKTIAPPHKWNT